MDTSSDSDVCVCVCVYVVCTDVWLTLPYGVIEM